VISADCPFCKIASGDDVEAREVYRDKLSVAFFPSEPATLGHTLLIPRSHVSDIWSLPEDLAAHLARVSVRLAAAISRTVIPEGLNVIQSNGAAATQTVFHLHIHLVPRWDQDAIGRIWPPETSYTEQQKDDVWERLMAECARISTQ